MPINPEEAINLNINKKIVFKDENPEEIIGFSMVITNDHKVIYRAQRFSFGNVINNNQQSIEAVKGVIQNLQKLNTPRYKSNNFMQPDGSTELLSFEDFEEIEGVLDGFKTYQKNNSPKSRKIYWIDKSGTHNKGTIKPLLEINKPTLLVFTTNLPATFTPRHFQDCYIKPQDGFELDPECSKLRLWYGGRVLGLYSKFRSPSEDQKIVEYWYNLAVGFDYLNEDKTKLKRKSLNYYFDPGNGNGGGDRFP